MVSEPDSRDKRLAGRPISTFGCVPLAQAAAIRQVEHASGPSPAGMIAAELRETLVTENLAAVRY